VATEVLPLVPVTPIVFNFDEGLPWKFAATQPIDPDTLPTRM
jgi:hypothetical protein